VKRRVKWLSASVTLARVELVRTNSVLFSFDRKSIYQTCDILNTHFLFGQFEARTFLKTVYILLSA